MSILWAKILEMFNQMGNGEKEVNLLLEDKIDELAAIFQSCIWNPENPNPICLEKSVILMFLNSLNLHNLYKTMGKEEFKAMITSVNHDAFKKVVLIMKSTHPALVRQIRRLRAEARSSSALAA